MKMSYEFKSSIKSKKISFPLKIVGAIVFVLVILYFTAPQFLSAFFVTIVRPFWNIENTIKYGNLSVSIELENAKVIQLQKENEELKNLLGRYAPSSQNKILAQILKKPPFSAYDILIIDIGSDHNIKIGNKVYAVGNILIGEIAEIIGKTSKVKLYSSYGEKYDVLIGQKSIQAVASGQGGGAFEAVLPRDVKVQQGDIIIIPQLNDAVFATVVKVVSDPASSFSKIIFSQSVNIYEQRWVLVDKNY